jgi:hypothetical protein
MRSWTQSAICFVRQIAAIAAMARTASSWKRRTVVESRLTATTLSPTPLTPPTAPPQPRSGAVAISAHAVAQCAIETQRFWTIASMERCRSTRGERTAAPCRMDCRARLAVRGGRVARRSPLAQELRFSVKIELGLLNVHARASQSRREGAAEAVEVERLEAAPACSSNVSMRLTALSSSALSSTSSRGRFRLRRAITLTVVAKIFGLLVGWHAAAATAIVVASPISGLFVAFAMGREAAGCLVAAVALRAARITTSHRVRCSAGRGLRFGLTGAAPTVIIASPLASRLVACAVGRLAADVQIADEPLSAASNGAPSRGRALARGRCGLRAFRFFAGTAEDHHGAN